MNSPGQRWQGPKSDYPWEQQALDFIKGKLPDAEPYRAWQTFTFTTNHGHIREVDLFIATPGGLFLVEIKSHPGRAANNGSTWVFREDGNTRTIENPLHFTDLKAKELKGQLEWAAKQLGVRERIPRIEAVVFLSAETLRCEFDETQRQRVYGRDDRTKQTGLPGIWADFLDRPPASERNRVTPTLSKQLSKLLHKAGIGRLHKIGRVGPYELETKSFDACRLGRTTSRITRACRPTSPAGSASISRRGPRPTTSAGPPSAPPAASIWRCRASRTTGSSGRSSTATSCWLARRSSSSMAGTGSASITSWPPTRPWN